ncbi:DUF1631 family protein [Roseateles sp. BYS180W]|uniref:DUF1631 family protein n=1 Tax=Roseateles rivi TaxID=3299028 RepID=A0ABW7FRS8_9BURK
MHTQAQALKLQSLVDEAIAFTPTLVLQVHNALDSAIKTRPQYQYLQAGWLKRRARFSPDFDDALRSLLEIARGGRDPLPRPPTASGTTASLSLIDERQALEDVGVAHVTSAVEEANRAELHQIGNYFAALHGIVRPVKTDNLLRPDVFAHALHRAVMGTDLDQEGRYAVMRLAADTMALELHRLYTLLGVRMQEARLADMVSSHAAGTRQPPPPVSVSSIRHTLGEAAQRVDEVNRASRQAAMDVPIITMRDLLRRLFVQILDDARLTPKLRELLSGLQPGLGHMVEHDPDLINSHHHPVWRVFNRIASHGSGYANIDDPDLLAFEAFLTRTLGPLHAKPELRHDDVVKLEQALDEYITEQALKRAQASSQVMEAMDREQNRDSYERLVREQLTAQLEEARAGKLLQRFLLGPWVRVITRAMVRDGREAPSVSRYVGTVDRLLSSLLPHNDEASRRMLRASLPQLVAELEGGMVSIEMSEEEREAVLKSLMVMHTRVLSGQQAQLDSPPQVDHRKLSSGEVLQHLVDEQESQLPSRWASSRIDRGHLPTVPVQLYQDSTAHQSAGEAREAWIQQMQVGDWYHLYIKGQWLSVQLAWVSESRQLFLVVGQDASVRHTITRGALEQLLISGLVTRLHEDELLERALGTVLQELEQLPPQ